MNQGICFLYINLFGLYRDQKFPSIPYLCSKDSKKRIIITGNIEKAELFDRPPPLKDFWSALLCRGGSLVDKVIVQFDTNNANSTDRPSEYRWYPRTLIKTLILVSAILTKIVFSLLTFFAV